MTIIRLVLLIVLFCLSACGSPQAMSANELALGMVQAAPVDPPLYAVLNGRPVANVPIETSFVTYFSYEYQEPTGSRVHTIHALIGPNQGERAPAKAVLDSQGHLFVYSGFGYLSTTRSESTTPGEPDQGNDEPQGATTSGATVQPSMSRPYLRTKRLRMTGEGTVYAVQATDAEDHGYYIDGEKYYASSALKEANKKEWLRDAKVKWFVSIADGDNFTGEGEYLLPASGNRKTFTDYLTPYTTALGLPNP